VKKPYPKNSLEQDVTYARKMYCYTSNISGLTKWVKRHMNRRFRREEKDRLRKLRGGKFVATAGGVTLDHIRKYVENQ